jgi:hypothetical protein
LEFIGTRLFLLLPVNEFSAPFCVSKRVPSGYYFFFQTIIQGQDPRRGLTAVAREMSDLGIESGA